MPDALVKFLNRLGYQPVFLPTTGVAPPELYTVIDRRLVRHGPLAKYFASEIIPKPRDAAVPDLVARETTRKSGAGALDFLRAALSCFGAQVGGKISGSTFSGHSWVFSFKDVTSKSVSPADIDTLFAKVRRANVRLPQSGGSHHVAYEYLFASRLVLRSFKGHTMSNDVNVALQGIADAHIEGLRSVASSSEMSFSAEDGRRVAFAYKAGRILEDAKHGWAFSPEEIVDASAGPDGLEVQPFLPLAGMAPTVEGE